MNDKLDTWPTELRLQDKGTALAVRFDNDESFQFSAEFLRVESPSAEVRGHGPGQETLIHGKSGVAILNVEPVGNYAVKLVFSDGHDTGIYSWETLLDYGRRQDEIWQAYLAKLGAKGVSR